MLSSSQSLRQYFRPAQTVSGQRTNKPKRAIPASLKWLGATLKLLAHVNRHWVIARLGELWFRVVKPKPKAWVHRYWVSADASAELHLADQIIPVYFWGQGPLVVCLHGWGGSGTQFRALIPKLVEQGYRVAAFDAPSHGYNPGNSTNVLEMAQTLMAIQRQFGAIDTVIAHSFGGMSTMTAAWQGLQLRRTVLIAPGLYVGELFDSFCDALDLGGALRRDFHAYIGGVMAQHMQEPNVWRFFTPENLLSYASPSGLFIYDDQDEEVSDETFRRCIGAWPGVEAFKTHGLGHYRILKAESVIEKISHWMGHPED